MLHLYKRFGLSVQEILVVVLIVGIAAAILLPAIINKIYDRQLKAKWKKEYSIISNVFQNIQQESVPICEYNDDGNCIGQSFTLEFLEKMISGMRKSDCYTGTIQADFCPQYNFKVRSRRVEDVLWTAYGSVEKYYSLGKKGTIGIDDFSELFILLNDGSAVYFGSGEDGLWIVVDVNNFKGGPNELGRDVYVLNVNSDLKNDRHWIKPAGAQNTPDAKNNESGSSGCSKDIGLKTTNSVHNAAGAGCSSRNLMSR